MHEARRRPIRRNPRYLHTARRVAPSSGGHVVSMVTPGTNVGFVSCDVRAIEHLSPHVPGAFLIFPVVPRVAGRVRLLPEALFGRRVIKTPIAPEETPVELRLAELFGHLGIARAHLAGRAGTDWQGFAARHPERVASVTLLCPAALDHAALQPLSSRLLVVTGDEGPGARRVHAVLPDLPRAETAVLRGYAGLTWSDLAAERGDEILDAMQDFLSRHDANPSPSAPAATVPVGEIAGISYRIQGVGPPLVLFPLELSPGQWGPLVPVLAAHWTTITLGGAHLGSVASLEERGRSGYIGVVRGLLDQLAIRPGEQVVEVGCGSGVIMRELARRTGGANRLTGVDQNLYLLREARALARREGLADRIGLREGSAEARRCRTASPMSPCAAPSPRKATPIGCLASSSASPNAAGASASSCGRSSADAGSISR